MYLVSIIISSIIATLCWLYLGSRILKKKINIKSTKSIIFSIIGVTLLVVINLNFNSFLKLVINYLLISVMVKLFFNEDINRVIASSFVILAYYFIAEIIFTIPLLIFTSIYNLNIENNAIILLLINIAITLIVLLLEGNKRIDILIQKFISLSDKLRSQETIFAILIAIAIFGRKNFDLFGLQYDYIMNLILLVIFIIITIFLYSEKEKRVILSDKYDQLLNYIEKYEIELTKKSLTIHEFRNQIIAIKGFIDPSDKKFNSYVNSIIEDIKNLEEKNLKSMEHIPKGGLKGLIYYKLGELSEKGIKIITKIDPKMKKSAFCSSDSKMYRDVLKIIGVCLDNAIEGISNTKQKEIIMEIYCYKNESHFILSNTYGGKININKIGTPGYSTKGKNRGYGFQLVKQIVNNYDNISQTWNVTEKYFNVHLTVKKR